MKGSGRTQVEGRKKKQVWKCLKGIIKKSRNKEGQMKL